MSEYNNNDNMEYSNLIKSIKDINVQMPNNFEDYVDNILIKLPKNHKYLYRKLAQIASVFIIIMITFSMLIYSNEEFAIFAKGIPVLNYLVELITADLGTENALQNNYPVKEPTIIKDGDYTLTIENMIIDEERISFTTILEGPYFHSSDNKIKNNRNGNYNYYYEVFPVISGGVSIANNFGDYNKNKVNITFGKSKEDYIRSILNSGEDLKFRCEIRKYKNVINENQIGKNENEYNEVIYSIEDIIVPISEKDVMITKHIEIDKALEFEEGTIYIDKMTISPTKMQIIGTEKPNEGYTSVGLEKVNLFDKSYSVYSNPSISKFGGGDGYVSYQFIPSIYFNDKVDEIFINYESYYYSLPHEAYTFSLADTFPKTYDYYGYKFTIEEVMVNNGEMTICYTLDNEAEFWIETLNIVGYELTRSKTRTYNEEGTDNKFFAYFNGIEEEEEFKFTLKNPKIIVEKSGKIKVPIDFED